MRLPQWVGRPLNLNMCSSEYCGESPMAGDDGVREPGRRAPALAHAERIRSGFHLDACQAGRWHRGQGSGAMAPGIRRPAHRDLPNAYFDASTQFGMYTSWRCGGSRRMARNLSAIVAGTS